MPHYYKTNELLDALLFAERTEENVTVTDRLHMYILNLKHINTNILCNSLPVFRIFFPHLNHFVLKTNLFQSGKNRK